MQLSSVQTPWLDRAINRAGRPFIERALGSRSRATNVFTLGAVCAGVLLLLNILYLGYLESLETWRLGFDDREFLQHGLSSSAGAISLQLSAILSVALFLIAPTLACQSMIKENESRTIDSLFLTPLSPRQLHNGFVFGSLVRVLNFCAPFFLLLVGIGVFTPWVNLSTVLSVVPLFLLGAWGMTSLGAMVGVLLRSVARGPLASLVVFALFALVLGMPFVGFDTSSTLHMTSLSPASAAFFAFGTDPNMWLNQTMDISPHSVGLFNTLKGVFFGLPIQPVVVSSLMMLGFGMVTTHVSTRKLQDTHRAPVAFHVAWLSIVGITLLVGMMVAFEFKFYRSDPMYVSRRGMGVWVLGALAVLPFFNLFLAGLMPSREYTDRVRLWSATRPAAAATMRDHLDIPRKAFFLGLSVVVLAFFPVLFNSRSPIGAVEFFTHTRIYAIIPMVLWGMFTPYLIHRLAQTGDRKPWQMVLAFLGLGAISIAGVVYSVVIVDESHLSVRDISWGPGPFGAILGLGFIAILLATPFILRSWLSSRQRDLEMHTEGRVGMCAAKPAQDAQPFEWPPAQLPEGRVDLLLRPSMYAPKGSARVSSWLALDDHTLLFWTGGEPGRTAKNGAVAVDLSKPFTLDASIHPNEGSTVQTLTTVHITVVQADPNQPTADPARIAFALPVHHKDFAGSLPKQVKSLPTVGPRDARKVLGFIRSYAEANGVRLPW